MLTIRQDQVEAFRQYHLQKFEDEMVQHSKEFSPILSKLLGEVQLRIALRSAMRRANDYGFTNRGPLRLFIEMMFLCGSAFDTDPQYAPVGEVLRSSEDQMARAERIHQGTLEYLDKVSGPDNINVRKALIELSNLAQAPFGFSTDDLAQRLLEETTRAFPQKVAYCGEKHMNMLIEEGFREARRYGFSKPRELALIVVLMFAFGHGCTEDPLYPWISRILRDERIVSPTARANRLEKKALTWLSHVLAMPAEGTHV
jgi:hypothetical protein